MLGVNNVLEGERWHYRAVAKSVGSVSVLKITQKLLTKIAIGNKTVGQQVIKQVDDHQENGLPNIDYLVCQDKQTPNIQFQRVLAYEKFLFWNKHCFYPNIGKVERFIMDI